MTTKGKAMADSTASQSVPQMIAAVDGSAISYHAVAWAAVEAVLRRRQLHILTSMALPGGFGPGMTLSDADMEWMRRDGERILTEASRIAREAVPGAELVLTTEVSFDFLIPTLIDRSHQVKMLVVGSRGIGAFQRGMLGSVSTAVTRHAHCPVAVIHDISGITPEWTDQPVVVGVDGSDNSVPAIELAFEEASLRKVGLTAVHTWSDVTGLDIPMADWDAMLESEQVLLAEQLAGYQERYPDVPVRRVVKVDRPARALLDESEHAQLLVVGSHGRGGFASMLLGSTSNKLLHSAQCPMIVVRDRERPPA
ncbi:universal stress protein [Nocardia amamiensis]|uniref:Universal stress protein n=1 Tax=Nocardia amamiensis TaxID=404578 RepID=A0ABS0D350_9NOCA|nr:universal stress protein [Nocardia amamiensis]MBF6301528.1 universal stress protein [Nocardia amamiensis]